MKNPKINKLVPKKKPHMATLNSDMEKESYKVTINVIQKLREIRRKKDISQEQLAFMIGVNRSYLGNIERCENVPSFAIIVKIAKALNTKLSSLFKESGS
jgi:DNA-binding XRE family transcriptional regulator